MSGTVVGWAYPCNAIFQVPLLFVGQLPRNLVRCQRAELVLRDSVVLPALPAGRASQQAPQQDTGMEAQEATGGLLSLLFVESLWFAGPWRGDT